MAVTPGSFIPWINSRVAPPPVEMYETSFSALSKFIKLAVSPPPMIDVALFFVLFIIL